ncbi:MAG TPA: MnhB domain-containing protein [Hanamia sp.]
MPELNTWNILTLIALLFLILFFKKGKNAIWGGFSGGIIIGIIWALIFVFKGEGWHWKFFLRGIVVGVLLGIATEMLGRIGDLFKPKNN